MSGAKKLTRDAYISKNTGNYPDKISVMGREYEKVEDLRYGTNPHQPAAFYRPAGAASPIGGMKILKTGKSGLSQTNLEDISCSLNIVKYFDRPACAVMKHVNPSGAAAAVKGMSVKDVYIAARDADPRAAFGGVAGFNVKVDAETAAEIMSTFMECVVAPDYDDEALKIFNDGEKNKLNKHIRIIKCGDLKSLPRYAGDETDLTNTVKVLADGSLVIAAPLLTKLRTAADFQKASAKDSSGNEIISTADASPEQLGDLLAAWYINISVRSNGVVIVKNGQTLTVGTGEQDRVGAVEQAIEKYKQKYKGRNDIKGSSMSSDGFFPFPDALETAAKAGVTVIAAPSGSLRDADVIKRANELGVAFYHAPERIFSHH
jgi:phosphoribosylaminoimidazolecarboxamide formyltransferase/IMP cyclohydrolase